MENDLIDELLHMENLFVDEEEIRLLIYDGVAHGRGLEVVLQGSADILHSSLVPDSVTGWDPAHADHIFIEPLDPAIGNGLLRKSVQFLIRMARDQFILEARPLRFLGAEVLGGTPIIRLSFPKIIQATSRRRMVRHLVPEDSPCVVNVRKKVKGANIQAQGFLFDIHESGLCFSTELSAAHLEVNDQVGIHLHANLEDSAEIHLIGRICSKTPFRNRQKSPRKLLYFGCEFLSISDHVSLELFVDSVKRHATEVRRKASTDQLSKHMFDNVRKRQQKRSGH